MVQIVEIEVLVIVEMVVVTSWVGVPWGGVTVLVTGQVVTVVWTLKHCQCEEMTICMETKDLHCRCNNFLGSSIW